MDPFMLHVSVQDITPEQLLEAIRQAGGVANGIIELLDDDMQPEKKMYVVNSNLAEEP